MGLGCSYAHNYDAWDLKVFHGAVGLSSILLSIGGLGRFVAFDVGYNDLEEKVPGEVCGSTQEAGALEHIASDCKGKHGAVPLVQCYCCTHKVNPSL
mmetsp:Transcript_453/g.1373  ORF Transcript_453/g.1373 Transcript_453/m.1373 type:complete len:97 (-) Transcript_453:107-397(-)